MAKKTTRKRTKKLQDHFQEISSVLEELMGDCDSEEQAYLHKPRTKGGVYERLGSLRLQKKQQQFEVEALKREKQELENELEDTKPRRPYDPDHPEDYDE